MIKIFNDFRTEQHAIVLDEADVLDVIDMINSRTNIREQHLRVLKYYSSEEDTSDYDWYISFKTRNRRWNALIQDFEEKGFTAVIKPENIVQLKKG